MISISVGIPTRDRYISLSHTLLSIALQTYPPKEIIIVDDTDSPVDVRTLPVYPYIFELLQNKGIEWRVVFGRKRGQHLSHQIIQDEAKGDYIFRIDDDCIAEPKTLEYLTAGVLPNIGAIAPLVLMPNPSSLPKGLTNTINDLQSPNVQWFKWNGTQEADHLYSCFLYKKGIVKYESNLSPVSHREETIFSYSLKLAGYKLFVLADAVVWHFRQDTGGIRSGTNAYMWEQDEKLFQNFLEKNGVKQINKKLVVLDSGLGDHFAFKNVLPELKKKYEKIVISCCNPEAFFDVEDIQLISIAEAKLMGNIEEYNIYRNMIDWNWKGNLEEAFIKLYL
jgi:glycosyltransferase involved in cell wall biosynthesis